MEGYIKVKKPIYLQVVKSKTEVGLCEKNNDFVGDQCRLSALLGLSA
jgi:hypothetical protein